MRKYHQILSTYVVWYATVVDGRAESNFVNKNGINVKEYISSP